MTITTRITRRNMLAMLAAAPAAAYLPRAFAATKLVLSSGFQESSHMVRNDRLFADAIKAASAAAITMEVHGNATLFKVPETKRAVQTNQIQLGELFLSGMANEDPIYALDGLPFLVKNVQEAAMLWQLQRPLVERRLEKQNLKLMWGVVWPGQSLFTNKPVNTFADLRGTKFRVQTPLTSRLAELMQVTGVRVETADLPQAFLTKVIEGMYTASATGVGAASWDYCKYTYETNAWFPKNIVVMNKKTFDALPPAHQKLLMEEAAKTEERGWKMEAEETINATAVLRKHGVTVAKPSDELMKEFQAIGRTMANEWVAQAGPEGKTLLEQFRKMTATA